MKLLTIVFVLFLSICAKAEVHAFFPENDATLLIQGTDSDATKLYDAMNVAPLANGEVLSKHISYETMYARPVFDLSCNKSQLSGAASCTLKFFSPEAVINKEQKSILMGVNDQFDSKTIAKQFNQISGDAYKAEVFQSTDKKFRIWKTFNSSGEVASLTMSYF